MISKIKVGDCHEEKSDVEMEEDLPAKCRNSDGIRRYVTDPGVQRWR